MKPDIRWQVLLALAGLAMVMMLLSYQVQSAALCAVSVPAPGGAFVEGIVGRPLSLNPLLSDPYPVDRELVNLIYDGLVAYDETGQVVPALAESWSLSEDNLTLTFTLQDGLLWHDGRPVTTEDVAFTYGLMRDESFPGPANLFTLWQSVTITIIDERQIQFTLPQPYAPFIEATTRGILPAHLLSGISAADLPTSAFNQAPVGTGPFMVQPGQDWQRTGRLRLTPNPNHWREGTQISDLEFRFFANTDDTLAAYHAGEIHAINKLPATLVPEVAAEDNTRLFTSIAPRYSALFFNLSETGAGTLKAKEVRQALAYGLDRTTLVDNVLNGQGVEFEGPYLPTAWSYRADLLTVYTYQPDTAAALLDAAGWVRDEVGIRAREGTPFSLRLIALDAPEHRAVAEEIARQWAESGIEAQLTLLADVDALRMILDNREYDVALIEVAPPNDPDLYDFWSQEAIVRGHNFTGWNNRRASEALEIGRQLYPQSERVLHYEAFLRQFDGDLPALTLYQHVNTYAMSDSVNQAEIGRIWQPRDRYRTLASWFLNFREVTVSCPAADEI
jgi:peptide/nickel transport system substrate-binding protein